MIILFPHQLFENHELLKSPQTIYLIEEWLFFRQYPFHKQKIAYHRATMQFYKDWLTENGHEVHYVEAFDEVSDIRVLIRRMANKNTKLNMLAPDDDWLKKRIEQTCRDENIPYEFHAHEGFINTEASLQKFFRKDKKHFHQTTFYKQERKRLNILIQGNGEPVGNQWTFDTENRKKFPKGKQAPTVQFPDTTHWYKEATDYVAKHFPDNPGELGAHQRYPITFEQSKDWLQQFFSERFAAFGTYEDAIVAHEKILHHSVLTPMLNIGLLTPKLVIEEALTFAEKENIGLNNTEGFVRQIIGWREFMHGIYLSIGSQQRTSNFWKFENKMPPSFYDGTTGIPPIDITIKKTLQTGYCHHIERLMILGNFMLLCEIDPDEVYKWFMELFIDAYDWVMVPNIYGMSQFADGGTMTTKPYISGSNYVMKMSDYQKGKWQEIWDGLFWRFIHLHQDFFTSQPRLSMMVRTWEKMNADKKNTHLTNAENFLRKLWE